MIARPVGHVRYPLWLVAQDANLDSPLPKGGELGCPVLQRSFNSDSLAAASIWDIHRAYSSLKGVAFPDKAKPSLTANSSMGTSSLISTLAATLTWIRYAWVEFTTGETAATGNCPCTNGRFAQALKRHFGQVVGKLLVSILHKPIFVCLVCFGIALAD